MTAVDDANETRNTRAAALDLMEHCPDALASESDFHAMLYCYSGRY
jgi:hypothetical protein